MANAPCSGFWTRVQTQLLVDDHLDRHRAAHGLLRRRRDRLVVGVGVQAVAVVEQRIKRLKCRADVVELYFLGVQAAARGLDVVLEHLAARPGAVEPRIARAQMRRATRPITAYSGSMPLEKKKLRLGAKSSINMPRLR